MIEATRDANRMMRNGFRDVRIYGLPFIFFAIASTLKIRSWQFGLWITPRWQITFCVQTVDECLT